MMGREEALPKLLPQRGWDSPRLVEAGQRLQAGTPQEGLGSGPLDGESLK